MEEEGGSPGIVVMGDGSCSRGHGLESWHRILDGHDIFHIYLLWEWYCLFEKTQKEAGLAHLKKESWK